MYVHRQLEQEIKPFLKRKEILAILGPRQSGKTTFLEFLAKELKKTKSVKFLTFEKRGDLELFQSNIEDFKKLYQSYQVIIIDEFQYAKDGGQKLKYLFDTTKTKFIISGSSSLDIVFQTGKYLVGRMMNFYLWPFSFREYLSFQDKDIFSLFIDSFPSSEIIFEKKEVASFGAEINLRIQKHFEEYLLFGGYPAVVLAPSLVEKKKVLESIMENYLLKDIRGLLHLATEENLLRLAKLLANQIGNLIEYKELGGASGLNYKNLLDHLEILKKTYIIDLIKPYFKNKRTELVKNPKVYFIDSGLRNFTVSDFRKVGERDDLGHLTENFVFSELRKNRGPLSPLNFWRSKSKAEVDFIIEREGDIIPLEVKYSENPSVGKSLYSFIDKYKSPEAFVLTKGFSGQIKWKNSKINFIPVYYL